MTDTIPPNPFGWIFPWPWLVFLNIHVLICTLLFCPMNSSYIGLCWLWADVLSSGHLLGRTSYTICRAQCKMKMWAVGSKIFWISKWQQQSMKPHTGPFWAASAQVVKALKPMVLRGFISSHFPFPVPWPGNSSEAVNWGGYRAFLLCVPSLRNHCCPFFVSCSVLENVVSCIFLGFLGCFREEKFISC